MINLSITANINGALKTLQQSSKKAAKGLASSAVHAAAIVRRNMFESMPQGSRRNRSRPGQPPFKQTGRLARSIKFAATPGGGARIFSNRQERRKGGDFLARLMESGTSTMAPRPFTRPAVTKALARLPVLMRTEVVKAFK